MNIIKRNQWIKKSKHVNVENKFILYLNMIVLIDIGIFSLNFVWHFESNGLSQVYFIFYGYDRRSGICSVNLKSY